MRIIAAELRKIDLPLRQPFETSFVRMTHKKFMLLKLTADDGTVGFGEISAFENPFYNEEFRNGSWALLIEQLLPRLFENKLSHPDDSLALFAGFRKNNMSKSGINTALWDIYAKQQHQPLAMALGGTKKRIETGVSIGIQDSPETLVNVVSKYIETGYRRIKVKIKPGKDYDYLKAVRDVYPDIMLMADANSAYRLSEAPQLKKLDALNLIMIEQPLEPEDLIDHATLQKQLKTAICLDESVNSLDDAKKMVAMQSGRIINIKVARVGGFSVARQIQAYAAQNGIACWTGGMLDSGVARAGNVAIATLDGYTLPNDIASSQRYYDADIIAPEVEMSGTYVNVPTGEGLGFDINQENVERYTIERFDLQKEY